MHQTVGVEHAHRAEFDSDRHRALEHALDLLRPRARRKIPVEVCMPKQRVADSTADAPCLKAGVPQLRGKRDNR
ncbi:hypothetical protein LBMAG44_15300 [Gemmatimonadota bacterium]|nr:hypothetical protein LBMAG44_15300 [Gemmatimonadota bacterium]